MIKKILEFFNDDFLEVSWLDLNFFPEVENLKEISRGFSSIVYKEEKSDKVICLSFDINKVLYLKKAKAPGFKFLGFHEIKVPPMYETDSDFRDGFVLMYEMDFLEEDDDIDWFFIDISGEPEDDSNKIDKILEQGYKINLGVIDSLEKKEYLPDFQFDLHAGQFLKDKSGDIICIDPIMSDNIYI